MRCFEEELKRDREKLNEINRHARVVLWFWLLYLSGFALFWIVEAGGTLR